VQNAPHVGPQRRIGGLLALGPPRLPAAGRVADLLETPRTGVVGAQRALDVAVIGVEQPRQVVGAEAGIELRIREQRLLGGLGQPELFGAPARGDERELEEPQRPTRERAPRRPLDSATIRPARRQGSTPDSRAATRSASSWLRTRR
jgi:hypothetical protein